MERELEMYAAAALVGIIAAHSVAEDFPAADEAAKQAFDYGAAMVREQERREEAETAPPSAKDQELDRKLDECRTTLGIEKTPAPKNALKEVTPVHAAK
jgi:hypothetical protein